MKKIIEDLEGATTGSRELDARIAAYLSSMETDCWSVPARRYTTSIDAAVTLMGGMTGWSMNQEDTMCQALMFRDGDGVIGRGDASTPALAICIAAMKARLDK